MRGYALYEYPRSREVNPGVAHRHQYPVAVGTVAFACTTRLTDPLVYILQWYSHSTGFRSSSSEQYVLLIFFSYARSPRP